MMKTMTKPARTSMTTMSTRHRRAAFGLAALAAAFLGGVAPAAAETVLIQKARIHTMGPQGVIDNADILFKDGVIQQVGRDIAAPAGATIVKGEGRVVTPGVIAPFTGLGIEEISLDDEANDSQIGRGFPLSAALDVVDAYNPTTSVIPVNRAGGVTRALVASSPGDKLFGGNAAVIDLSGRVASVTKSHAAQVVVMGAQGKTRAGGTRMGSWELLRETLAAAVDYGRNPRAYEQLPRDERFEISDLKALGSVVSGAEPMIVLVNSAAEIRNLIRLKRQFPVRPIVVGGSEAWRVAPELAAAKIPVILNPLYNLPNGFEDLGATLANAARLSAAGVEISFYDPQGSATHNQRLLPQLAGNAVANGLPYETALAALTLYPARMFGVDKELGSLERGKRADIVVWDGDPLETSTRPVDVYIDGAKTSLENRQTELRDRYRTLDASGLPFAYRGGK